MALLQKTRIISQERIDLKDYRNLEDFICADFKAIFKYTQTSDNYVYSGFESTGTGTNQLTVALAGSSLVMGAAGGTFYAGAPSLSKLDTTALTPASTNYIEIEIVQDTGGADSRAMWDQTANSGQGGEFSQIIDTYIYSDARLVINASNFSGEAHKVQICEADVNASGIITEIRDARNMFFRLGTANDPDHMFSWSSRIEPLNTQFNGADKDIKTEKAWKDAVMSRITELDGVQNWYETSNVSNIGAFRNASLSSVTSIGNGAFWRWDGNELELADNNTSPDENDLITAIRFFDSLFDIQLTRQEVGREIQEITFSAIPTSGNFVLEQDGDLSDPITFKADADDVLNACNAQFSNQLLKVTGDFTRGFKLIFQAAGPQALVTVDSSTLKRSSANVTITPSLVRPGFVGSQAIPMADGEVLWVELPKPLANKTFKDVGITSANFRVSARGSVPMNDSTFWLAHREGNNVYIRGLGELEPGEILEISDNVSENIIQAIGLASETSMPSYSSTNVVTQNFSIVAAVSDLDEKAGEIDNRLNSLGLSVLDSNHAVAVVNPAIVALLSGYEQGQLLGTSLMDLSGAQIDFQTGDIFEADGSTPYGTPFIPFAIPNGEFFWYGISVVPGNDTADNMSEGMLQVDPAQSSDASKNDAKKPNITGDVKLGAIQVYNDNGTIEIVDIVTLPIGAGSGGGSGAFKVKAYDPVSTTLPSGPTITIDGESLVNGDLVLFSNLASDNNRVFKVTGIGVAANWAPVRAFKTGFVPASSDQVIVAEGILFKNQVATFDGTDWKVNDLVRYFSGTDYFEQSSLKTTQLDNNTTGNVFSVNAAGSENIIVDYSMNRAGIKETGTIYITHDNVDAVLANNSASFGPIGVTFEAVINGTDIELNYETDALGAPTIMKFSVKRWSDAPGGPSGLPSYPGGGGGGGGYVTFAAYVMSDNSGIPTHCDPVYNVVGKTRVDLAFNYVTGLNAGTTCGELEVYVNGQRVPRQIPGTTLDAYYIEIDNSTIEFYQDLTPVPVSIEVIKRS